MMFRIILFSVGRQFNFYVNFYYGYNPRGTIPYTPWPYIFKSKNKKQKQNKKQNKTKQNKTKTKKHCVIAFVY